MSVMSFTPIDELPEIDMALEIELENLEFMSLNEFFEKYRTWFEYKSGKKKGQTNPKKLDAGVDLYNVWMYACLGRYGERPQNVIATGNVGFDDFFECNFLKIEKKPKNERFVDFYYIVLQNAYPRPLNYYWKDNKKVMIKCRD